MGLYEKIADLPLEIDDYRLEQFTSDTSSEFTRVTTVFSFVGDGVVGHGEDVTYATEAHDNLGSIDTPWSLDGAFTIESFSRHLDDVSLFPSGGDTQEIFTNYRRWALESAALDLALKQQAVSLGDHLGMDYHPVRFIVSTRLGSPPSVERLERLQEGNQALEFKLDPTSEWTTELIDTLAALDSVVILDLKGQYEDTIVDQAADPALYEQVIDAFPNALLEDPALNPETRPLFMGHEERVTWDYPITGIDDIQTLPWEPRWLNLKPSRFGSLRAIFDTIDYCRSEDIRLFGGGQFELDVGRSHLHTLASLFYPDAPNDIAPTEYNMPEPPSDAPDSPLVPSSEPAGLKFVPVDR